jgi:SAM-dependent methyltransferase
MGIGLKAARFLIEETLKRPFSGSVLTLGVQKTPFTLGLLCKSARQIGLAASAISTFESLPEKQRATDRQLLELLGFDEIMRSDVSDYEGAELIFDLNDSRGPPPEFRHRFDCVIDGGTLEHVFHVPNALKNIFEFLRVGGRIIHMSPTNNYVDHGFYSFSPTFFYDFYSENRFELNQCQLIRHNKEVEKRPWIAANYTPGSLDHVSFGGLDDNMYVTFFVGTKRAESTWDRVPEQSLYKKKKWTENSQGNVARRQFSRRTTIQKISRKAKRLDDYLRRRLGVARFPIKPTICY